MRNMKIKGAFYKDSNFINVFSGNSLYVIPRNAPENWGRVKVGDWMSGCHATLTQELFDSWKNECEEEGVFTLQR